MIFLDIISWKQESKMKIISWNIHYDNNFITKYNHIMKKHPDILILLECTKSSFDFAKNNGWNYRNWYNDDLNGEFSELGVAIFSKKYEIEFTESFNRNYRYVIPYKIKYDNSEFTIFATWTKTKSK